MYQLVDIENPKLIRNIQNYLNLNTTIPTVKEENRVSYSYFMNDVLNIVVKEFGISIEDIKSKKRDRELTIPRQLFCYIVRKHAPFIALATIGSKINKDHATVLHAGKIIQNHIDLNDLLYRHEIKLCVNNVLAKWTSVATVARRNANMDIEYKNSELKMIK